MERFVEELGTTIAGLILIVMLLSFTSSQAETVGRAFDRTDTLEKVERFDLVVPHADNVVSVKGGDVIGAIRFYQGTPNLEIHVVGWGTTVVYGTGPAQISTGYSPLHYIGIGSELEFYEADFRVSNTNGNVITYTKI